MTSLAVPVHGPHGEVLASLNVGTHSSRHTPEGLRHLALAPLTEAARQLERDLALAGVRSAGRSQL